MKQIRSNFFKPHTHETTLAHVNLNREEKQLIVRKLAIGVSFDAILDDIRDNAHGQLERLHLTTRRDLKNIEKQFSIRHNLQLHKNDAVSVDIWVTSMNKLEEDSPVLYYNRQGVEHDDFSSEDLIVVLMHLSISNGSSELFWFQYNMCEFNPWNQ